MAANLFRINDQQRRARLGRRHHLAGSARAGDVVTVAGDLVGLHGSDPAAVFLSARARLRRPEGTVAGLEAALYGERTLVRTLCMRRTMFVVPLDLVPVVQAAVTDALVPGERKRLVKMVEESGIADDGAAWLAAAEAATVAELTARKEATGAELSRAIPALAHQIAVGEGKAWAGTIGMSTRVLFLLSTGQRVVRGRPRGTWSSSQYRWSPMEAWLPSGVPTMPADVARAELTRRYLASFGPATTNDLKWWTGWTVAYTKAALMAVNAVEVALAEGTGWVLPGDEGPVRAPGRWVALLPSLDPTTMGWQQRAWYLGGHGSALFDRNGNAGPTVWVDGRVVGGWAQRRSGEIVHRLLEDTGGETAAAVAEAAVELQTWFGPMRITPRFPTPLQKTLSAGELDK
ncbi:MAG TPA: winged helix DNA-binding domain-containing protein [Acidimicrobiia bacterium]|nr:winged helix DNA-binding domain-containing protein [Acidimicrobiia bacterium]